MKQTILLLVTLLCIIATANAQMTEYNADSGHKFYYINVKYGERVEWHDRTFVLAQDIYASIQSKIDKAEDTQERAEKDFENKIRVLYEKNKDYMWERFPDYKYTFEEVYKEVRGRSIRMDYYDHIDNIFTCTIEAEVVKKLKSNKFYRKPYILGYIYIDDETKNKIVESGSL